MGVIRALLDSRLLWLSLLCVLLWAGGRRLVRELAYDPRFEAQPEWMHARGPAWGGQEVLEPVVQRLQELGPVNLFDPAFERRIRGALLELSGVASVERIRRRWPCRYIVEVRLRRPVAVVEFADRDIAVTAAGRRLDLPPRGDACGGLLRIRGVQDGPPRSGEVWRSERLADGLATARQLAACLDVLEPIGIETVDVADAADPRRGVVLRGADGVTIRWGRPRAAVGENTVAKKIGYLRTAARHLELLRGQEFDVRYGVPYLRESTSP